MATLSEADRLKVWAHSMRGPEGIGCVLKTQLKSAVDAVDNWVESNAASYNTALPSPFQTAATTTQKYLLLMYVLMRRMNHLTVEGE